MTHESEREYADAVEEHLVDLFGRRAVDREHYVSDTGAFADFWVDLGVVILAVEVENDEDSVRPGVAQALEYALNDPRAVPVVVTPPGHVEDAQVQAMRAICPIVELPAGGDHGG